MRFLLDANLSPRIALGLRDAGHHAIHVVDCGLVTATDETIFDHAAAEGRILITVDGDFAMLLAHRKATRPSVIQLRGVADLSPEAHLELLLANLPSIGPAVIDRAIVSLGPGRLSIRELPLT